MNPIALAPTTLSKVPPLEYIAIAAKAGYDAIGFRLYPSPHLPFFPVVGDAQLMREVRKALDDSNLRVYDVFTCYITPDMDFDAMKRAHEFGAELGAQYALVIGDDPDWGRSVDSFGRLCDNAAEFGLVCAVEAPVNRRRLNTLQLNLKLIEESARNAVLSVDPAQFIRAGHSFDELKSVPSSMLPYSQINDTQSMTMGDPMCTPGEGIVPLYDLLDLLPPDAMLSLEYHHRDESYTSEEWARFALDGTRAFLQRYYESKQQ